MFEIEGQLVILRWKNNVMKNITKLLYGFDTWKIWKYSIGLKHFITISLQNRKCQNSNNNFLI